MHDDQPDRRQRSLCRHAAQYLDNGEPKEWIVFWHTDEQKTARIVEALQDAAKGEEAIEEMETLADFMFAVQNLPHAGERALRAQMRDAWVADVERRILEAVVGGEEEE